MATYHVQGKVISKVTKLGASFAQVEVFEVDALASTFRSEVITSVISNEEGDFHATFDYSGGKPDSPARPDIIFRVSQHIDGLHHVIYNENPAEHTRWNIDDRIQVTLEAEDCISVALPSSGAPHNNLFTFTRVGLIQVSDIDQTDGYAFPDEDPARPNSLNANAPFGGYLDICGWFGIFTGVTYYKIKRSKSKGTTEELNDPLHNLRYDAILGEFVSEKMGPFTIGGVDNLYKRPDYGLPWVYPDRLIRWDSTKFEDGMHTLEVEAFREAGDVIIQLITPSSNLEVDPEFGTLKLQIDNTPSTTCEIKGISHEKIVVEEGDILEFMSGTLSVEFEAYDENGHLGTYALSAIYDQDQYVTPPPESPEKAGDNYANHIAPHSKTWNGGTYTVHYPATKYPMSEMPVGIYTFQLSVSKRTTDGYGLIYPSREDNKHIALRR